MERALRLQVSDPDAANELWAAIDRRIVDAAPIVSLINLRAVDFVSKRIGNYQFNPEFGMLLDQLWVR